MAILKNSGMRDITLSHPEFDPVTIPMGVEGKNSEGDDVIIEGSTHVPNALLVALAGNQVIKHHFENGTLKTSNEDSNETKVEDIEQTSSTSEANETQQDNSFLDGSVVDPFAAPVKKGK